MFSVDLCIIVLMRGAWKKSPKSRLINYQVLLPNCFVFSCKARGEFDIATTVAYTRALCCTSLHYLHALDV